VCIKLVTFRIKYFV